MVWPKKFGTVKNAQWWEPRVVDPASPRASTSQAHDPPYDRTDELSLLLAYFQHRVVLEALEVLGRRGKTREEFAKWIGVSPTNLQRKFRGASWGSISDYATWARHLQPEILPTVSGWGTFLPSTLKKRSGSIT